MRPVRHDNLVHDLLTGVEDAVQDALVLESIRPAVFQIPFGSCNGAGFGLALLPLYDSTCDAVAKMAMLGARLADIDILIREQTHETS